MGTFILATSLITIMLLEKIYFLMSEPLFFSGFLGKLEILVLLVFFIFAFVKFFKREEKHESVSKSGRIRNWGIAIGLLCLLVVGASFYLNIGKKALAWDSVALYDARAKFLLLGTKFSDMGSLTKYDIHNSYYYLLYPPFTSLAHFFWYKLGIQWAVGLQYSVYLLLLALGIYFGTKKSLGSNLAFLLVFLTISSNAVFSSSLAEYTNLPFTLFLVVGIFLLVQYVKTKDLWSLICGSLLVATSQWIRYLEPIWIGIFLAFMITELQKTKLRRVFKIASILGLLSLFEYLIWKYFVSGVARNPAIVDLQTTYLVEPLLGVFTGALLSIFVFYMKSWGIILLLHASALLTGVGFRRRVGKKEKSEIIFLKLVIIFTLLIYFSGLYFVSFQSVWWDKLGDSLVRSSTFLLPISAYIILDFIKSKVFESSN